MADKIMAPVLSRLFVAGFVRLHILFHAAEEPICGVEIVAELAHHGYRSSPGTVYSALHELTRAGYLASRARVVSGKRPRHYEATAEGRAALQAAKEKLRELAAEVLEEPASEGRRAGRRTRYRGTACFGGVSSQRSCRMSRLCCDKSGRA